MHVSCLLQIQYMLTDRKENTRNFKFWIQSNYKIPGFLSLRTLINYCLSHVKYLMLNMLNISKYRTLKQYQTATITNSVVASFLLNKNIKHLNLFLKYKTIKKKKKTFKFALISAFTFLISHFLPLTWLGPPHPVSLYFTDFLTTGGR